MADDDGQFHFDPVTYLDMIRSEVPAYDAFQDAVATATADLLVGRVLELGVGTGETAARVLALHPTAEWVGIDESEGMLAAAAERLGGGPDLRVGRLEDGLPVGPFDLAVSALAVHHLDGDGKVDLFRRVVERLRPGGRFVLGDLVVPDDPADAVTQIDGVYDVPSTLDEQLRWLAEVGFDARAVWTHQDLAVIVADRA